MTSAVKSPRKRAAKVAAPGAIRITLQGIMAVPDDFGRVRVLLVDEFPDGTRDYSAAALRRAIPDNKNMSVPYRIKEHADDGVLGEFWCVLPQRYAKHWTAVAAELRGRPVKEEATLRPFQMVVRGNDGPDGEESETINSGMSLDVALIEEVRPRT